VASPHSSTSLVGWTLLPSTGLRVEGTDPSVSQYRQDPGPLPVSSLCVALTLRSAPHSELCWGHQNPNSSTKARLLEHALETQEQLSPAFLPQTGLPRGPQRCQHEDNNLGVRMAWTAVASASQEVVTPGSPALPPTPQSGQREAKPGM
jgi:hypothetical protein